MGPTVRERADAVATFRFVAVYLMETLACWVPTAPELEAKTLFGRHLWDLAQHADQFGRRTAELRLALHQSRPPLAPYARVLADAASLTATADRLAVLYEVLLPDLARRYDAYLADTDHLLDEPTVRILERVQADLRRMGEDHASMRRERPDIGAGDGTAERFARSTSAIADFVDYRPASAVATA
jgi:hypothetical protein